MIMRKRYVALTLLLLLFLSGCVGNINQSSSQAPASNTYEMPYCGMTITLPGDYQAVEDTPYDAQFTNGNSYLSIFAYSYIDLAADWEAYDVYEAQLQDLISKRDNTEQIVEPKIEFYDDKTVLTELWSGEKDGTKNYYYCALIEFPSEDQGCAWVVVSGMPSYVLNHVNAIDEILATAQYETSN